MHHQFLSDAKDKSRPGYSFHITTSDLLDVDNVIDLATFYSAHKVIDKVRKYWLSIDGAPVHAYTEEELRQRAAKALTSPAA